MKSNFSFLKSHFPVLENFGELAEKYLYNDSNSCLMKLGMIGETIVNLCFTYDKISLPRDNTAVNRIDNLFDEGMIRDFVEDDRWDGIIRTAIAKHSDYRLEGAGDDREGMHARIIRDADKL